MTPSSKWPIGFTLVKFQESSSRELHTKLSRILPAPRVFISAMQIQEKNFLLLLYILSLTFPRKKRKALCYMALIKREILTSREVFCKKGAFQKTVLFFLFFSLKMSA